MMCSRTCFFLAILITFISGFACETPAETSIAYPAPANYIDEEIDALLSSSEECVFVGNFSDALVIVDKVETLLPLTDDENDYRKLRSMFDRAVIVTCLEGPNENSYRHFDNFHTLLASKSCHSNIHKHQPDLFDQNGHWPILGSGPISVDECLDRVATTEKSLEIACAGLNASPAARVAIASSVYVISKQARRCCTENGFWKTCIQPVVDKWKRAELFGVPPDPYWD